MPAKKRKSDISNPTTSKKTKNTHAAAIETVQNVISDPGGFDTSDRPSEMRRILVELSEYARSLEGQVKFLQPKEKSSEELKDAAQKLRAAAKSGIVQQMKWRPTCREGRAKWMYDGVCADPALFGAFLGLDAPPSFKMKKFPLEDFENLVGRIHASARYSTLTLTSDVTIRWNEIEGTFKCSGMYG